MVENARKACFLLIDPDDSFNECNQKVKIFSDIFFIVIEIKTYEFKDKYNDIFRKMSVGLLYFNGCRWIEKI